MGQNLAPTKPIYENLESELEFINKQTGLPKKDLEELYQSFSAKSEKGQITKKEFLAGYKTFYPQAMNPTKLAERVFKAGDTDKDGTISFREFALIMYIMTKAPKEDKLNAIFGILDLDGNGTLSSAEVIQAVKQAYDIMGQLNVDFSNKGIEVFRTLDLDGDMRIDSEEFVKACLQDEQICKLLEEGLCGQAMSISDKH